MKKDSEDIFSATNPAFCALIIHYFLEGFGETNKNGTDYPILFLPIPILLSGDIMSTLKQSNKTTGFLNWITSHPTVKLGFSERVENTAQITKNAILFASANGLLSASESGHFFSLGKVKEQEMKKLNLNSYTVIAERFGYWVGKLNSTKTLFYSLGITL